MQFASNYLSPWFARGATVLHGGEGPYWGHNAIFRLQAFAACCGLPTLPGKAPQGGHILSLVEDGRVVGVCALFRDGSDRYELARMAVEPDERGKGYGDALLTAALRRAREDGVRSVYLLSNRKLAPAIGLYRKHGFETVADGPHPVYARCDVVMELRLAAPA